MVNFPSPLPDELIYSLLARARVKYCEVSPKQLLDKVFGSRSVISSLHFPSNIQPLVTHHLSSSLSTTELVHSHTLFPLYAPFMPDKRRLECLDAMHDKSFGQPYLATGFAASRIPNLKNIRYCPHCMSEQIDENGEPYWQRIHQVVGLESCARHNTMLEVATYCQSREHRHEYFPASNFLCTAKPRREQCEYDDRLSQPIYELLNRVESPSPSYMQWTQYYQELIKLNNCNKGKYADYETIKERVLSRWPIEWLKQYNLHQLDGQSSWLHGMTRKHRKSFSYLEHIVMLGSLHNGKWSINEVIEEALLIIVEKPVKTAVKYKEIIDKNIRANKLFWLNKVKEVGAKKARKTAGGTYMQLYRRHRDWLLNINKRYQWPIEYENTRVDWQKRDKSFVKQLIHIRNRNESDLSLPWLSRKWYINQLPTPSSIERRLVKLPLTNKFINRYAETITEYQVRRIAKVTIENDVMNIPLWVLLRKAGLSKERMTKTTEKLMRFAWVFQR
jgi:hypothetical protein